MPWILRPALSLRASVSPPMSSATMTTPRSMLAAKSCLSSIMSRRRMIPVRFSTEPGNTRYATTRVKVMNAQAHGAVAVVIVAEPNRKHLTNAERHARIGSSAVRAIPLPLQAIQDDEVHIPSAIVLDAVAAELFATAGITPSAAQTAIDRDLKPQSRSLPDTTLTLHFRNAPSAPGLRTMWLVCCRAAIRGLRPKPS